MGGPAGGRLLAPRMIVAICVLGLALSANRMSAQALPVPRAGFRAEVSAVPPSLNVRTGFIESRTFWKEGGIIGGGITALIATAFVLDEESGAPFYAVPPAIALSFLVGAGPGAFLGGLIPKPARVATPTAEGPR